MYSYAASSRGARFGYDAEEDTHENCTEPSEPEPNSPPSESLWSSIWGSVKSVASSAVTMVKTAKTTAVSIFKSIKTANKEAREEQARNAEKAGTSDRGSLWQRSKAFIKNMYNKVVEKVKQIPEKVKQIPGKVKDKARGIWNDLKNGAKNIQEAAKSSWCKIKSGWNDMKQLWREATTADGVPFRERCWHLISGAKDVICKTATQVIRSIMQLAKDALMYAVDSITSTVTGIFDAATRALTALGECIYGFFKTCFNVGYAIYFGIKNANLGSFLHAGLDIIYSVVAKTASMIVNLAKFARDTFYSKIEEVYTSVTDFLRNVQSVIINVIKLGADSVVMTMTSIITIAKAIVQLSPIMFVYALTNLFVSVISALQTVGSIGISLVKMLIQAYQLRVMVFSMFKSTWTKTKLFAKRSIAITRRGMKHVVNVAKQLKHPWKCIKKISKICFVEVKKIAVYYWESLKTTGLSCMRAAKSIMTTLKKPITYFASQIQMLLSKRSQISCRKLRKSALEKLQKVFSCMKVTVSERCGICSIVCQNAYRHLKECPTDFFLTSCKYCLLARSLIMEQIDKCTLPIRKMVEKVLTPISKATSGIESIVSDINSIRNNLQRKPDALDKYEQDKREQIQKIMESMEESIYEQANTDEENTKTEIDFMEGLKQASAALGNLESDINSAQGSVDHISSSTAKELVWDAFRTSVLNHKERDWTEKPKQRRTISRSSQH